MLLHNTFEILQHDELNSFPILTIIKELISLAFEYLVRRSCRPTSVLSLLP
jgi:hypothetical protein